MRNRKEEPNETANYKFNISNASIYIYIAKHNGEREKKEKETDLGRKNIFSSRSFFLFDITCT